MRRTANPWSQAVKPESLLLTAVLALFIASPAILHSSQHPGDVALPERLPSDRGRTLPTQQAKRALVVYVYSGSDPEYEANLRFFVREAVKVRGASRCLQPHGGCGTRHRIVSMDALSGFVRPPTSPASDDMSPQTGRLWPRQALKLGSTVYDADRVTSTFAGAPHPPGLQRFADCSDAKTVAAVMAGRRWLRLHHRGAIRRGPAGPAAAAGAAGRQRAIRAPRQRVPGHRDRRLGAGQPRAGPQVRLV